MTASLIPCPPAAILNPQALLDGPPATALSPLESSALAAVETGWDDARRLAEMAKNYSRASTAAKALCGIKLRALREYYYGPRNPNGGRPKSASRNLPETVSGFSSWDEMLADRVGVTERVGRNWVQMADVVEQMAEARGLDLRGICEKLPWDWTPEEAVTIEHAVRRLTENQTQRQLLQADFLCDLGYAAPVRINSSNNPLGNNGGKKKLAANPAELLRERQEAARLVFLGTDKPGRVAQGSVAMFMENFISKGGLQMEALPQAELRDLYEHTVKPFAAAFRKIANL